MSDDPGVIAASDQGHAEAEETLTKLIKLWGQARARCDLGRSDEVAALTHILAACSPSSYAGLLATAISRLADIESDLTYG
jgi:hypothetical protein